LDIALGRSGALDQSRRQPQRPPQTRFFPRHLSTIGFVIVAGQVQQPVQDQDLHLVGRAVSQAACVASGDFRRDSNVAGGTTPTTETRRHGGF
jgi:hypothetical protein